jgi:hypothetical protein
VPDRDKLSAILARWNWRLVDAFDNPVPGGWLRAGAKGFIAQAGDVLVASIAGTEPGSMGDWFQNFDIHVDADGAHRGFLDGARAAFTPVVGAMSNHAGPTYLTGHSLGGVIAAMTAGLMDQTHSDRLLGVYTIGMPRPGKAQYSTPYNARLGARTFRLVHGDDLVAKVPLSSLGFRHVGSLLACPRGGTFAGQPSVPPDEPSSLDESLQIARAALNLFDGNSAPAFPAQEWLAAQAAARLSEPIRDHLTDRYLRALGAL